LSVTSPGAGRIETAEPLRRVIEQGPGLWTQQGRRRCRPGPLGAI